MENPTNESSSSSSSIGFCLLPLELIHNILFNLSFPQIIRLKSVNKSISDLISDQIFIRDYNSRSTSTSWLFVYRKRWHRDAHLHGFSDQHSDHRWFKFQIAYLLKPILPPGETLYFLASSSNFFLFSCNTLKQLIAVDLGRNAVKKIPHSPLGPRGTSSWRRSGMKLVSGSDNNNFRFLFAELVNDQSVLYVYRSQDNTWQTKVTRSGRVGSTTDCIFLNVVNGPHQSLIIGVGSEEDPVVLRPRFYGGGENDVMEKLHVYGDGHMMIVKSKGVGEAETEGRMLNEIEVWGFGFRGLEWEFKTRVPKRIIEEIKKVYRVIMGCLEKRNGVIRVALLSNYEGLWDIIWLSYDIERCYWTWIPLPQPNIKGLNMAGISFSSTLTL